MIIVKNAELFEKTNVEENELCFDPESKDLDVSNLDTSKLTNMGYMFSDCSNLTTLDLSNFDTSKVTDMSDMFRSCYNLTTIKGVIDMKSCANYKDMFDRCPKLRDVKIKNPPAGFDGAGLSSSQYTIVS